MDRVFSIPPSAGAALFRFHAIFRVACVFALMLCAFAPAQASEGAKKEGAVVLDVPIPNLTLSLMVEDSRVVGRLELSLQVHATDASAAGKIEEMLPRIRDLLMTRITPTPIPGTSNLSAQTLTEMKSSILDLLHDVLGANAVDAVYIVKAVTRRI
jgi:flagellar basal body-associated protein FliL